MCILAQTWDAVGGIKILKMTQWFSGQAMASMDKRVYVYKEDLHWA